MQRLPDDVFARVDGVVAQTAAVRGTEDEIWHLNVLRRELTRARSEEARLTEELKKRDETIKVLARILDRARIAVEDGHILDKKYTTSGADTLLREIMSALDLVRTP